MMFNVLVSMEGGSDHYSKVCTHCSLFEVSV
jgi:hypothetical protein